MCDWIKFLHWLFLFILFLFSCSCRPIAGGEGELDDVPDGEGELEYADQETPEEEFDDFPVIGTCRALYQFEGNNSLNVLPEHF